MRNRRALLGTGVFLLGALASWGAGPSAFSQEKETGWELVVAYDPVAKKLSNPPVVLRPNLAQPVYFYLKNKTLLNKKNIDVALVRFGAKGERVISVTKLEKVGSNVAELIKFKPAPPVKAEAPGKEPVPAPADVDSPPFKFELRVIEPGKEAVAFPFVMNMMQPLEYTQVDLPVYDRNRNRISVRVQVNADSAEPPCFVRLNMDDQLIPGLLAPKQASLTAKLTPKNRDAILFGENLQFVGGAPPKYGRIALTIDGYERAYQYKTTFEQGNLRPLRDDNPRLRVRAPAFYNNDQKPGPKGELPQLILHLEADGVLDTEIQLEVAVNRGADRAFVEPQLFPGLREQKLGIEAMPEGGLLCKTLVRDWTMALDTTGLLGRRTVRLRALAPDGPMELADEQPPSDEALPLFVANAVPGLAQLRYDRADRAVYADIIIDSTPPGDVKLVDLPGQLMPGQKVLLKARTAERDRSEQAPITSVLFFLGDAPKEGVIGKLDPASKLWLAEVLIPSDAKDQLAVTARATTAAGLTAASDKKLVPVGGPAAAGDSRITGVVKWDTRVQAGKPVQLLGDKNKVLATTQTDDNGIYVFTPVKTGTYRVFCNISASALRGTAVATVTKDKGETIKADVNVSR